VFGTVLGLDDGILGMIMVINTFGDYARYHLHFHALPPIACFHRMGPSIAPPKETQEKLNYTTHGDTVNIASRLEGYEKDSFDWQGETLCRILIGEATRRLVDQHFEVEKVGE
jgi:hypothetical protein